MRLFVSLFAYAFGKIHYPDVASAVSREIARAEASAVPGFRTLHRFRKIADVTLYTDHSTLIARARDRAAGRFLASAADVWIAIDDDVDADDVACKRLLDGAPGAGVLAAAMRMRSADRAFNVSTSLPIPVGVVSPVNRVGLALSRVRRDALEQVAAAHRDLEWDEPEAVIGGASRATWTAPGVFVETIAHREWIPEDWAFCERARLAGVGVYAIVLPGIMHAGIPNVST